MAGSSDAVPVYIESGSKRTFAGALDWPGWCRSGRDEAAALQALLDCAPRYARALRLEEIPFQVPANLAAFAVAERLKGGTGTDFGAPEMAPSSDSRPVDDAELLCLQRILQACWRALDDAAQAAAGKALRKGPRGGGREVEEILRHVRDAETAYLSKLGWKVKLEEGEEPQAAVQRRRQSVLEGLTAAAHGEIPAKGPRGGTHWTPRYFTRRAAWHILDHAWEIEDRVI